ncbi:hypothetical protein KKG31_00825 [Patescibacteria group bacterium]|nr:hypothetical protein [Patescibacteria group bacterium]MBU1757726.1 hypothetical protein [Patescibacteria group bacterium]
MPNMADSEKMHQDWMESQKRTNEAIAKEQGNEIAKAKRKTKREKKLADKEKLKQRWEQKPLTQRFKPAKKLRRERAEMLKNLKREIKMQKRAERRAAQGRQKKFEKTCYRKLVSRIAA